MMLRKWIKMFGVVKYTKQHEWVQYLSAEKRARVGITNYAQQQLGEIVFVDMPAIGTKVNLGKPCSTIQSVKTAAEVYSPVDGTILEVNQQVKKEVNLINQKPDKSWLVEILCQKEPTNLLSKEEYDSFVKQDKH